jgi:tRNA G18 (ribose-2'-O)-methylase SpoU
MVRTETRRNRYSRKKDGAMSLPVSFTTINFEFDDNLAFLIRTAACYGMSHINVIGSIPDRKNLNPKSGSLFDYVEIRKYLTPRDFLNRMTADGVKLISADISDNAHSLYEYDFDTESESTIILGNESTGIPVEIMINSEEVFIPMPGIGFCLNTSQSGTAFATEYSRQYFSRGVI